MAAAQNVTAIPDRNLKRAYPLETKIIMRRDFRRKVSARLHWPWMTRAVPLIALASLIACSRTPARAPQAELHVAAAANLTRVLAELASVYERRANVRIVPSYGATAQLSQQIENGAPFDVFMSADTQRVDGLVARGFATPGAAAVYARGVLVLWAPRRPDVRKLDELAGPKNMVIIVARPELAPYGAASVEALKNMGIWDKVAKRVAYAPSISVAKQWADTGNGDVAFTAMSLILDEPGNYFLIDPGLYTPIEQSMCVLKTTSKPDLARAFQQFVLGPDAREILRRYGYGLPPQPAGQGMGAG
jgi:molybdate transport system substrate-binding protein